MQIRDEYHTTREQYHTDEDIITETEWVRLKNVGDKKSKHLTSRNYLTAAPTKF